MQLSLVTFSKIAATDFFTPLSDLTLIPESDRSESGRAYLLRTDFFFLLALVALGGDVDGEGGLGGWKVVRQTHYNKKFYCSFMYY